MSYSTKPHLALCLSDQCVTARGPDLEVVPAEGDDGDWYCPACGEPTMNFTKSEVDDFVRAYLPGIVAAAEREKLERLEERLR